MPYEKGQEDVFVELVGQLEFAKSNAERAWRAALAQGTDNPTTAVHGLVSVMQKIREQ